MTAREPIAGAAAWQGREMADHPRWRRDLTPAEIEETVLEQIARQWMLEPPGHGHSKGFRGARSPQIILPCRA